MDFTQKWVKYHLKLNTCKTAIAVPRTTIAFVIIKHNLRGKTSRYFRPSPWFGDRICDNGRYHATSGFRSIQ